MTKKRRIKQLSLLVLLSAVVALSGFMLWCEVTDRKQENDTFLSLAELAQTEPPEETIPVVAEPAEESNPQPQVEPSPVHKRNLSALTEQNADCVGWLFIDGTVIDYPVMHTPYEPQKYLRIDFYGSYSVSGVPFLDGRCTASGDNLIIYGHNMKNGTMFSNLKGYLEADYCAAHPAIEYETAAGCETYTVFAVATVKKTDEWYAFLNASSSEDFAQKIAYIQSKSLYDTGFTPVCGQQLLTLSTCYGSGKDGRLLVIAVKTN